MNKKGFTLVELLAVIVLLAVIMTLASVSMTAMRRNLNKRMFEEKIQASLQAAKTWGQDNKSQVTTSGITKTIQDMVNNNYLSTDELVDSCDANDKKNSEGKCYVVINNLTEEVVNDIEIKIYLEMNRVYSCVLNNENNQNLLGEEFEKNDLICS